MGPVFNQNQIFFTAAGLHIAALAAGVGAGDEVITTPMTFAASANCALYCGAKPVFADINPETYNIDPASVEKCVTDKTNPQPPEYPTRQYTDAHNIFSVF